MPRKTNKSIGLFSQAKKKLYVQQLVAPKGSKDISDSLKKLDKFVEKSDGPRSFQLAHGLDLKLPELCPGSVVSVLLQAAIFVKENKASKAEEILAQFAEKSSDKSRILHFAGAQVAAAAGHPLVAVASLEKIPDIQHMPATVATLVTLRERAGDIDGADAIFDAAIRWWSNAMIEENKLSIIMREAAAFKLKHGRKEDAAHLYEELVKSHGSIEALVGLIRTTAHIDVDKAEAYEKKLLLMKEISVH